MRADRRDLRADVEVEQLEAIEHVLRTEARDGADDLRCRQAELRAVARRVHPLPRTATRESGANAEMGSDAELAGGLDDEIELAHAVDHDDRRAAEALGEQGELDVCAVLEAVADDQGVGRVEQRQRDQELGLAPRLDADAVFGTVLDDLVHDVPLLIDLDRVNAAETPTVSVPLDRVLKRRGELLDARRQDVGKADEQGGSQVAALEILDEGEQIDGGLFGVRSHHDVPRIVDVEEIAAPVGDAVDVQTVADRPSAHRCVLRSAHSPDPLRGSTRIVVASGLSV